MTLSFRAGDHTHLPIRAAAFVALVCVAILALSGWTELVSRNTGLKNSESDLSNLASSLAQHAEDTLARRHDSIRLGLPTR
jgi:hypothetical protein